MPGAPLLERVHQTPESIEQGLSWIVSVRRSWITRKRSNKGF